MLSDAVLSGWCDDALGAAADRVLSRRQHLSQVVALELTDGRQVVVKARPFEARVDRAARLVRAQMSAWHAAARVGHGDWESQNIAWQDGTALAVHDWDSVIAQPEPAIVGLAAAVWPARDIRHVKTPVSGQW